MLDKLARLGARAVSGARQAGGAVAASPVSEIMSGVSKNAPSKLRHLPLYGMGAIFAGDIAAGTGMPQQIRDSILPGGGMEQYAEDELETMLAQWGEIKRRQKLEAETAKNAAMLAALDPQLYTEVLAGRRLPRGARVFGGTPRTDLLQELSLHMAQGQTPSGGEGSDMGFLMR